MKIFVTGGTSSIGRVLVREWGAEGLALRLLVRPNSDRSGLELPGVEFVQGDVTDLHAVRLGMSGCERAVHLAALVGHNLPETEWWRVNRDGARNVLQAAYDQGLERMVQVSTLAVLGPTRPGEVADESRPIDPALHRNLYQKTKFAADELAREYAGRGLGVAIVYPGFGFGHSRASSHPSMHEQTLLRMAAGKPVVIFGSGRNRLLLAYYKDTVRGIRLALEAGKPGEGYILGNESLTFPQIWAEIARLLGKRPPFLRVPAGLLKFIAQTTRAMGGHSPFPPDFFDMISFNWNFSNAKARGELGWQPLSFAAALAETWEEYQSL